MAHGKHAQRRRRRARDHRWQERRPAVQHFFAMLEAARVAQREKDDDGTVR